MNILRKEYFGYLIYSDKKQQSYYISEKTGTELCSYIKYKKDISDELFNKVKNMLSVSTLDNRAIRVIDNKQDSMLKNCLSAPIDVIWCYTHKCNMNCVHCYIDKIGSSISLSDADIIIRKLSEAGVFRVSLTGGEPLYDIKLLEYILRKLHGSGMNIYLTTNATLITFEIISLLQQFNVCSVQVSMDLGFNSQIPNIISHRAMINGVKKLISANINVNPVLVMTKYNYDHMEFILNEIINLGIKYVKFERLIVSGEAENYNVNLEEKIVLRKLTDLESQFGDKVVISYSDFYGSLNKKAHNNFVKWDCEGGRTKLYIDIKGNCSPCVYSGGINYHVGNLIVDTFENIWTKSPMLINFRNSSVKDNGRCSSCNNNKSCAGACKSNSLKFNGTLKGPDSFCMKGVKEI